MEENLRARLSLFADLGLETKEPEKTPEAEKAVEDIVEVETIKAEIEVLEEVEAITEIDETFENLEEREETAEIEQQNSEHRNSSPSILRELAGLSIKIAIIALTAIITFTFVFGFYRNTDPDMTPMVKSGDLVMYYRLDKNYSPGDLLVLDFNGELQVRRVIARAGDVVDIDERGLKINNAWQQEQGIYQETWQYEEGIDFPLTVGAGQVFVLGDERENATDSRMYGAVDVESTRGTVVTVIRRRNF